MNDLIWFLLFYIIEFLPLYIIASKSGEENAWFAFVPFLNLWLMCEMADVPIYYLLAFMIPGINIIILIYLWSQIAENTNKSPLWGILMILPGINLAVGYYLALYEPKSSRY